MDAFEQVAKILGLTVNADTQQFLDRIDTLENRITRVEELEKENIALLSRAETDEAKLICNKARTLQKQTKHLSFSAAVELAKSELGARAESDKYELPERAKAKLLCKQAEALMQRFPELSFHKAFDLARDNISEPPPYLTKGRVRSLDAISGMGAQ